MTHGWARSGGSPERDPDGAAGGGRPRGRRSSPGERRERHAAIEDQEVVLAAGFRFLESRARSIAETRRRLVGAGYRAELVDGAIDRLLELGLLDDPAFARRWIESRDRSRPRGEGALRHELAVRGVAREVIDEALADRVAPDGAPLARSGQPEGEETDRDRGLRPFGAPGGTGDVDDRAAAAEGAEESAARRLLDRKRRDLERVEDPRKRRARAYSLLARNGFAPDLCARLAAETV